MATDHPSSDWVINSYPNLWNDANNLSKRIAAMLFCAPVDVTEAVNGSMRNRFRCSRRNRQVTFEQVCSSVALVICVRANRMTAKIAMRIHIGGLGSEGFRFFLVIQMGAQS